MAEIVLAAKLESLRRCLQRIEAKKPAKLQRPINDEHKQDIVILILTRAVQSLRSHYQQCESLLHQKQSSDNNHRSC